MHIMKIKEVPIRNNFLGDITDIPPAEYNYAAICSLTRIIARSRRITKGSFRLKTILTRPGDSRKPLDEKKLFLSLCVNDKCR